VPAWLIWPVYLPVTTLVGRLTLLAMSDLARHSLALVPVVAIPVVLWAARRLVMLHRCRRSSPRAPLS
jgi:hypothetical protein